MKIDEATSNNFLEKFVNQPLLLDKFSKISLGHGPVDLALPITRFLNINSWPAFILMVYASSYMPLKSLPFFYLTSAMKKEGLIKNATRQTFVAQRWQILAAEGKITS